MAETGGIYNEEPAFGIHQEDIHCTKLIMATSLKAIPHFAAACRSFADGLKAAGVIVLSLASASS